MFQEDEEPHEKVYAMKIIHKPTLKKERTAIYYPGGEFEMSDAHEKVIMEIDNWSQMNHPNIVRMYELIDCE